MAYEKHEWQDGELITSSSLNNLEDGVETAITTSSVGFEKNVLGFGLINDGVTDNTTAIKNLISSLDTGDSIFFPTGLYKISENIVIDKTINIRGVKPTYYNGDLINGSVIMGGGGLFFTTGSSYSYVSGMGVKTSSGFKNSFDVRGTIDGITFDNCIAIANSHGFLIESYEGLVNNTTVKNSEAHDSIHGFISKASNTNFENDIASNVQFWGFGIITDNIPAIDKVGAAINNVLSNVRAYNCGAGIIFYRRNYFENNSTTVPNIGHQLTNVFVSNSTYSIRIGDAVGDTGSGTYTTYPVTNLNIVNLKETSSKFQSQNAENVSVSNAQLSQGADVLNDDTHYNSKIFVSGISGSNFGSVGNLIKLDSTATPSISFGDRFITSNSSSTTITSFLNGVNGKTFKVMIYDANTKITSSDSISLNSGDVFGYGSSVEFVIQNGNFYEISRFNPRYLSYQIRATNISSVNPNTSRVVDLVQSSDDTVSTTFTISSPERRDANLTVVSRSISGTITPPAFNPTQFVVPSDLPTGALNFGTCLVTTWVYIDGLKRYILTNWYTTKYA